jgi:hypothetical protein
MLTPRVERDQATAQVDNARTAVLNKTWLTASARWYPGFTHDGGPAEIEVDVAA